MRMNQSRATAREGEGGKSGLVRASIKQLRSFVGTNTVAVTVRRAVRVVATMSPMIASLETRRRRRRPRHCHQQQQQLAVASRHVVCHVALGGALVIAQANRPFQLSRLASRSLSIRQDRYRHPDRVLIRVDKCHRRCRLPRRRATCERDMEAQAKSVRKKNKGEKDGDVRVASDAADIFNDSLFEFWGRFVLGESVICSQC